jgi:hypothetical protein
MKTGAACAFLWLILNCFIFETIAWYAQAALVFDNFHPSAFTTAFPISTVPTLVVPAL